MIMKKARVLLSLVLAAVICISFAGCKSNKDDSADTSQSTTQAAATESTSGNDTTNASTPVESTDTTEQSSTSTTQKQSTTKKVQKTTAPADSDSKSPITVNQALDILDNDFYGKGYEVNATVKEGGYQYFSVYDKNGNKYASVKVDLSTADAVETLTNSSGAPNTFNLYSIS